jgi:uncharacterized membrane protein
MSVITGCGGGAAGAAGTPNCAVQAQAATTAGGYVVTVTGKSGSITQSTSFNVTLR